ncbi:MAG: hypothetical protein V4548_13305 [Bacteroidota bacterium]
MSWDVLIINSEKPVDFEKDNWPNFLSKQKIINDITSIFPETNWDDSSWGILENEFADIEFNIGDNENIGNNFMLHIRGGKNPVKEIFKMCSQNSWIAFDLSSGNYIDENLNQTGFNSWKKHRDEVISKEKVKKPWWKF